MSTDRAQVSDWLRRYVEAWKSYDREAIGDLFSEDVVYTDHPYEEPIRGREAVVERWLRDPDPSGTYEGEYEPLAVDGDVAVATGTSTYRGPDGEVEELWHNCFVLRFDPDGRCGELTEYYVKTPRP